jgi:hypothetical protein
MPIAGFSRPGDGAGGLKIADKLNFVANLNTKGQNASMSDNTSVLVSKVSNLGNVGSKQYASGSGTSNGSTNAIIAGLAFAPKYIIVRYTYGSNPIFHTIASSPAINGVNSSNNVAINVGSGGASGYTTTSATTSDGATFTTLGPSLSYTYEAFGS